MRRLILLWVLGLSACAHGPPRSTIEEGFESSQRAYFEALASRDLDRLLELFAEESVLHLANRPPVRGREAIGQLYSNVFRFMQHSESQTETSRIAVAGDLAYSEGRVRNVFAGRGDSVAFDGKYLLVWQRQPAGWRVLIYAVSSDSAD